METSTLTASEVIQINGTFPLRILGKHGGRKYLASPYELTLDNLEASFLNDDPRIAHFQVVSADRNPGFKRHFLYSRAEQRHLVTSSGYLFTGNVDVNLDRTKRFSKIELFHVNGDEENKTCGLDNAIAEHTRRIDGLKVDNITLKEAMEFYDIMRYHVPNI